MQNKDFDVAGSDVVLTGWHIAKVVDNNDPKQCERVLVSVIGIHDVDKASVDYSIWADCCGHSKFASGDIPDVGDYLWVQFVNPIDPMRCIWFGWVRGIIE